MTRYALQTTSSFDRYEAVTCESIFMVVWNFDEQKCLDAMGDVKKICREVGGNIEEDAIECSLCHLLSLRDLFVCSDGGSRRMWFFQMLLSALEKGNYIHRRGLFQS